ncbi:MAG TPA: fibronectin type III domain-containing protein [Solirubrobacteraceae bacterium]
MFQYRIYRKEHTQTTWPTAATATVAAATTAYTQTGLTNGTTYDYRVRAVDLGNQLSVTSNTVSVTPGT